VARFRPFQSGPKVAVGAVAGHVVVAVGLTMRGAVRHSRPLSLPSRPTQAPNDGLRVRVATKVGCRRRVPPETWRATFGPQSRRTCIGRPSAAATIGSSALAARYLFLTIPHTSSSQGSTSGASPEIGREGLRRTVPYTSLSLIRFFLSSVRSRRVLSDSLPALRGDLLRRCRKEQAFKALGKSGPLMYSFIRQRFPCVERRSLAKFVRRSST
jgi:hypothetical protein